MSPEVDIDRIAAINNKFVHREDFEKLFSDILDVYLYSQSRPIKKSNVDTMNYESNELFWKDIISNKQFEGNPIELKNFNIIEWLPLSPGIYFLPESKEKRRDAKSLYYENNEYIPLGKFEMILGGMGSLRLKSRLINSKKYYFLGATSNGISHQGIPLAISEEIYKKIIRRIKDTGGCLCDITGSLEVLPNELSIIQYKDKVPKFYILGDEIELIGDSNKDDLATTIAIMFPSSRGSTDQERSFNKFWSYCHFNPSNEKSFRRALNWLQNYAIRYSNMDNPPILNDFDEYYNHFTNPVEFPIQSLTSENFNLGRILQYVSHYGITINNIYKGDVIMGNVFKNIENSTIINNSNVENSFNKVKNEYNEDGE
jgi:hypothetical protein